MTISKWHVYHYGDRENRKNKIFRSEKILFDRYYFLKMVFKNGLKLLAFWGGLNFDAAT